MLASPSSGSSDAWVIEDFPAWHLAFSREAACRIESGQGFRFVVTQCSIDGPSLMTRWFSLTPVTKAMSSHNKCRVPLQKKDQNICVWWVNMDHCGARTWTIECMQRQLGICLLMIAFMVKLTLMCSYTLSTRDTTKGFCSWRPFCTQLASWEQFFTQSGFFKHWTAAKPSITATSFLVAASSESAVWTSCKVAAWLFVSSFSKTITSSYFWMNSAI